MDSMMKKYVQDNRDEITIFDNLCGFCGGVASYKIMKEVLRDISKNNGPVTKIGCLVIRGVIAFRTGQYLASKVQELRMQLDYILNEPEVILDDEEVD